MGTKRLPVPKDPARRGPWPVGARTLEIDGRKVEVWYPARVGSAAGKATATYDIREHLPRAEAAKVSDAANVPQPCNCYRDLPIDKKHGPYPIVAFFHGAGSFRTQSAALATHWASRGFVVVAPDLPLINLRTALGEPVPGNPFEAGVAVVRAARDGKGPFASFAGTTRSDRIGLVGHSFGGGVARAARNESGVVAIITMASGGIGTSARPLNTLILGGTADGVVPLSRQRAAFDKEPSPARLIAIDRAGHLAFSDLCLIGRERGGMLEIAVAAGINVPGVVRRLARDGCEARNLPPRRGLEIIGYASTAALEESLQCDAGATAALASIRATYPEIKDTQRK
jgi:dienelactone hydrolase